MTIFKIILLISYGILFTGGFQPMLHAWEIQNWDMFFSKSLYLGLLSFYTAFVYLLFSSDRVYGYFLKKEEEESSKRKSPRKI